MISFEPFNNYLKEHGITKYHLIQTGVLTPTIVTRLLCHHNFNLKFIDNLCRELDCQPGDIIEFIPDDKEQ